MNGLPYYKAYPRDFIEGTVGMRFELKAAYRLVLDLIYMQGGRLPDDARYIAGLLGCSVRAWKGYREELISEGKIYAENGIISNFRADKELETSRTLSRKNAENRTKSNKNKGLQKRTFDEYTDTDTDIEDAASAASSRAAPDQVSHSPPKTEPGPPHKPSSPIDDLTEIERRLRIAANAVGSPEPGLLVVGPVVGAIAEGADLEMDVLPVIAARCRGGFRPRSWGYFLPAIAEAKARRMAAGRATREARAPPGQASNMAASRPKTIQQYAIERLRQEHERMDENALDERASGPGFGVDEFLAIPPSGSG